MVLVLSFCSQEQRWPWRILESPSLLPLALALGYFPLEIALSTSTRWLLWSGGSGVIHIDATSTINTFPDAHGSWVSFTPL